MIIRVTKSVLLVPCRLMRVHFNGPGRAPGTPDCKSLYEAAHQGGPPASDVLIQDMLKQIHDFFDAIIGAMP